MAEKKMKQGKLVGVTTIQVECPECGGACVNAIGSYMIEMSDEILTCEDCKAECKVPLRAFTIK